MFGRGGGLFYMNKPSISAIEHKARQRFGVEFAHVFPFRFRLYGDYVTWWGLAIGVDHTIIGLRRSLDELPALVQRGRVDYRSAPRLRPETKVSEVAPTRRRSLGRIL